MALPEQVIRSYEAIVKLESTPSPIEFAQLVNQAIPPINTDGYVIYQFNRSKYLADKRRFVADVRGFQPYQAMILWTDKEDILKFFKLSNKIDIQWSKQLNCFLAAKEPLRHDSLGDYLDDSDDQMDRLYKRVAMIQARSASI